MKLSFVASILLHLSILSPILLVVSKNSSEKLPPQAMDVFFTNVAPLDSLPAKETRSHKVTRERRPVILKKLFTLTDPVVDYPRSTGDTATGKETTTTIVETGKSNNVLFEIRGSEEDRPLLDSLSELLHRSLGYPEDLYRLHPEGLVSGVLSFSARTGIDLEALRFSAREKYLGVHLIRELLELRESHNQRLASLIGDPSKTRSIELRVRYVSGSDRELRQHPAPRVFKEQIDAQRNFYDPTRVRIGVTQITLGSNEKTLDNFLNLSWRFDLESIFDKSYRKRHGVSGEKRSQQQENALRVKYDTLLNTFRENNWLRIG